MKDNSPLWFSFRAKKDSVKAVYVYSHGVHILTLGVSAGNSGTTVGLEGFFGIGGFESCTTDKTGIYNAFKCWHFRIPFLGIPGFGSWVRKPTWFWRRYSVMLSKLARLIDTRYN